ncbi:uncharacterized protein PAC_19686 [Phialocephala subalpina]|uniref:Uncharacterized protein n=1 Tax=Phialocephala subalpina TaxID=576137 RepID=A0A1L7XXT0_9HELO|nr:uncharacterized protein PAC_19686 [Phialocephala subalpina]
MPAPASAIQKTAAVAIHREGLSVLSCPADAALDIVFLHGLNGHPHDSWANHKTGFFWPSEFAGNTPTVRAMAFGYIADFSSGSHNSMGITQHAEALLVNLRNNRPKELRHRPLAFVCHSLGGLVVKQALVLSSMKDPYKEILSSTRLICFMGTPHRGSHVLEKMKVSMLEKLAKAAFQEIPYNLKTALKPRANELFEINDAFASVKGSLAIINFYEQKHVRGLGELIVDKDSAVLYFENEESIQVYRDHRELIRFENAEDDAYRLVFQTLQVKISTLLSQDKGKAHQDVTRQMRMECLRSLKFPESEKRANDISEPSGNTLGWLWEDEIGFVKWLERDRGIYWVGGKPGSGKSTLMKEMASQYQEKYSKKGFVCATHFFDDRGTFLERSFEGFLRSVLEQLLRQEPLLFDCLMEAFRQHFDHTCCCCREDDEIRWNLRSLNVAFRTIVLKGPSNIRLCLFVDALDECDNPVKDFISFFEELTRNEKLHIKVCFSSRNISEDLLSSFSMGQGFILQERNSKDIKKFVNDRLSSSFSILEHDKDLIFSQDLLELKDEIIQKADGVFLWVNIVLSEFERGLENGNTVAELRENLKAIPSELSGLFDILLGKIDPAYIPETNIMLSIVLIAVRPLTLSEFRYAMAFSSDKEFDSYSDMKASKAVVQTDLAMMKRIRSRCGGLLEAKVLLDPDGPTSNSSPKKIVQFIHQSVKDYFISGREAVNTKIWNSKDLMAKGQANLCQVCLKYMCTSEIQNVPLLLEKSYDVPQEDENSTFTEDYPLLQYSVMSWTTHCKEAEKLGLPQNGYLDEFGQEDNKHFEIWREVHDWLKPSNPFGADTTPLQIAVQYDIISFVRTQLENGMDINIILSGWFTSYLQMAAYFDNENMVDLLLDHGADVEARGSGCKSVLTAACHSGNASIVKKILKAGAETSNYGMMNSPLWAAITAALSGKAEVVQALHDHDKETFQNDWSRHMALFYVGMDNLEKRTVSDDDRIPWIQYMLMKNSHAVIKKLLADDSEMCNRRDRNGITLLHLTCMGGDEKAVKLLLDNGADPTAETGDGLTILHAALMNRSASILRYLLGLGFDPNVVDYYGITPIHEAARIGSDVQLSLLIAARGDNAVSDSHGFLPIHHAMSNLSLTNHKGNLNALIPQEFGIDVPGCDGSTPLHIATRYGNLSHVQWLLEQGVDLMAVDSDGRTALHCVAANSNEYAQDIMELLIEKGLNVRRKDDAGFTPLHNTLYWQKGPFRSSHRSVFRVQIFKAKVRLLLQKGADLNDRDNCGNTLLHLACAKGSRPVVRLLLDEGADPDLEDFKGCKPIEFARRNDIRVLLGD